MHLREGDGARVKLRVGRGELPSSLRNAIRAEQVIACLDPRVVVRDERGVGLRCLVRRRSIRCTDGTARPVPAGYRASRPRRRSRQTAPRPLLDTGPGETAGRYSFLAVDVPVGGGPRPHVHQEADEWFYVQQGIPLPVDHHAITSPRATSCTFPWALPTGSRYLMRRSRCSPDTVQQARSSPSCRTGRAP